MRDTNSAPMTSASKAALVTGAGSGIGRAIARALDADGWIVIAADLRLETARETIAPMRQTGYAFEADVADPASVAALAAQVAELHHVDVICNNAGIFDNYRCAHETDLALWERINAVNVNGPYLVTTSFLPGMLTRGRGTIINTASIASVTGGAGGAAYTTSKHAVLGFTRQLAFDYGPRGIRANAICPGPVATPLSEGAQAGTHPHLDRMLASMPTNRWAQPEEIAEVAVFLADDRSRYVNGAAIMVDGGWTSV